MGQQQLLLIALGVIVVGIAVVLGITVFHSYSVDAKRNNLINEGINLASHAQQYFKKPENLRGGGNTFNGWDIPSELRRTTNGEYSASVFADSVVITAVGNEIVTSGTPVEVAVTIRSDSYRVKIIH